MIPVIAANFVTQTGRDHEFSKEGAVGSDRAIDRCHRYWFESRIGGR
jgi:hypothetical protein